MADFVAVLRKTIDGMGETTPETRERVYEKARSTIAAKLAAINPPPPAAVADRQRQALEDAIRQVEADYTDVEVGEPADPLAALENVFASLQEKPVVTPKAAPPPPSYAESKPWPTTTARVSPPQFPAPPPAAKQERRDFDRRDEDGVDNDFSPVREDRSAMPPRDDRGVAGVPQPERAFANVDNDDVEDDADDGDFDQPERRRSYSGLIAAAVALVVVAGGGYAVWLNKDEFGRMLGMGGSEVAVTEPAQPEQPAPAQPEETAAAAPPAGEAETPKFTQRLNADGTEVDEGAAGGEPTIGEGTSVAAVTQLPVATPPVGTPPAGDTATSGQPAVAVGQKAIFYEERTNVAQGSAETGSIVWSLVQESPGGDLPAEPAIRAEATIPGKDLQLRMTIRRNGDKTLPASHIVELIFLTPDGFEGGGIESILRFTLKDSEEATGNQLLGIPAKIADGFFLVALNDTPAEIDANMTLLRREKWIDVPIVYKSGRRALITMEKGIPGDKVFDEALKAWQTTASAG